MSKQISIGDSVRYFCFTDGCLREGIVTAVDVPVEWLWEWAEHGTVMQSRHKQNGAAHPMGVQINGSLARPYYRNDKSRVQA